MRRENGFRLLLVLRFNYLDTRVEAHREQGNHNIRYRERNDEVVRYDSQFVISHYRDADEKVTCKIKFAIVLFRVTRGVDIR